MVLMTAASGGQNDGGDKKWAQACQEDSSVRDAAVFGGGAGVERCGASFGWSRGWREDRGRE